MMTEKTFMKLTNSIKEKVAFYLSPTEALSAQL